MQALGNIIEAALVGFINHYVAGFSNCKESSEYRRFMKTVKLPRPGLVFSKRPGLNPNGGTPALLGDARAARMAMQALENIRRSCIAGNHITTSYMCGPEDWLPHIDQI